MANLAQAGSLGFGIGLGYKIPDYTPEIMSAIKGGVEGFGEGISTGIKEYAKQEAEKKKERAEDIDNIKKNITITDIHPNLEDKAATISATLLDAQKEYYKENPRGRFSNTAEYRGMYEDLKNVITDSKNLWEEEKRIAANTDYFAESEYEKIKTITDPVERGRAFDKYISLQQGGTDRPRVLEGSVAKSYPFDARAAITRQWNPTVYNTKEEVPSGEYFVTKSGKYIDRQATLNTATTIIDSPAKTGRILLNEYLTKEDPALAPQERMENARIKAIGEAYGILEREYAAVSAKTIQKQSEGKGGIANSGINLVPETGSEGLDLSTFHNNQYERYKSDWTEQINLEDNAKKTAGDYIKEGRIQTKEKFVKSYTDEFGTLIPHQVSIVKIGGGELPASDFYDKSGKKIKGNPIGFIENPNTGAKYVKVGVTESVTVRNEKTGEIRNVSMRRDYFAPLSNSENRNWANNFLKDVNIEDYFAEQFGKTQLETKKEEKPKEEKIDYSKYPKSSDGKWYFDGKDWKAIKQ